MRRVSWFLLAFLGASVFSFSAQGGGASGESLSLPSLVRKMRETVSLASFRLSADVYSTGGSSQEPVLSEEVRVVVAGPRSYVERKSIALDANGTQTYPKRTVAAFDGRSYTKVTTFEGDRQPLAWQGSENGNGRDIGGLLFGGLTVAQLDDMELRPDSYLIVQNQNTGLFEIHTQGSVPSVAFVDPEKGFVVTRVETRDEEGNLVKVCEVSLVSRSGKWFPSELRVDSLADGELKPEFVIRLGALEPEPAVESTLFRADIPQTARVMHASVSASEVAQMRAESGLETPLKAVETASSSSFSETADPAGKSVAAEPAGADSVPVASKKSRTRGPWPLWSAGVAIAIGVGLGMFRRMRRR